MTFNPSDTFEERFLKLTPDQKKIRAKLLRNEPYTLSAVPINFHNFPPGLYGNIDAFMEYYESGNCAADYDAMLAFQAMQFERHIEVCAEQYRSQIAVIPSPEIVRERRMSTEESASLD